MRRVAPDDHALLYDQYYTLEVTRELASFHRCFDPQYGCDPPESLGFGREYHYNPGARVSLLSNAEEVYATVKYVGECRDDCAGTPPKHCYHPSAGKGFMHGICSNTCHVKVYLDGKALTTPLSHNSFRSGQEESIRLFKAQLSESWVNRRVELVMPWGGEVHLRGLTLQRVSDDRLPTAERPAGKPFTFVAYGDSITQGYCAGTPYPEIIGRINGWNAINLGIGGLKITPSHGGSIGRFHPNLVLMAIGTNDWWRTCNVRPGIGSTIENFRRANATLPMVIVTMLARSDEPSRNSRSCVLEDFRDQVRREVAYRRARGDRQLYLIEGRPLLSLERLGDGLHPRDSKAMEELALNLNAQMGFSTIQYSLVCPSLQVRAHGLSRRSPAALYWGADPMQNLPLEAPCEGRSAMVAGRKLLVHTDSDGRATFDVPTELCSQTIFQVVDWTTCTVSRVGRANHTSSIAGAVAEHFTPLFGRAKHESPPVPSPSSPPPSPTFPPATPRLEGRLPRRPAESSPLIPISAGVAPMRPPLVPFISSPLPMAFSPSILVPHHPTFPRAPQHASDQVLLNLPTDQGGIGAPENQRPRAPPSYPSTLVATVMKMREYPSIQALVSFGVTMWAFMICKRAYSNTRACLQRNRRRSGMWYNSLSLKNNHARDSWQASAVPARKHRRNRHPAIVPIRSNATH